MMINNVYFWLILHEKYAMLQTLQMHHTLISFRFYALNLMPRYHIIRIWRRFFMLFEKIPFYFEELSAYNTALLCFYDMRFLTDIMSRTKLHWFICNTLPNMQYHRFILPHFLLLNDNRSYTFFYACQNFLLIRGFFIMKCRITLLNTLTSSEIPSM